MHSTITPTRVTLLRDTLLRMEALRRMLYIEKLRLEEYSRVVPVGGKNTINTRS